MMLKVIQRLHPAGGRVIALGSFDGVHRGHETLLRTAKGLSVEIGAPLRICTFNRHPLEVLRPGNPPEMLSTIPEKARRMALLEADEIELIPFDRDTADMEPEAFLETLRRMVKVEAVVAGWNYSFGRRGRGNADLLREDGDKHGYRVEIVPPAKTAEGTVISSSLIRRLLSEGEIDQAAKLLGYSYTMTGTLCRPAEDKGKNILDIRMWKRKALPADGTYTCLLETGDVTLPAMLRTGAAPRNSGYRQAEIHLLWDEPADPGRKVRVTLVSLIHRDDGLNGTALREKIREDREEARRMFDMA